MTGERKEHGRPGEERGPEKRPGRKEPYYPGYFGTEEEEGVVREQDDAEVEGEKGEPRRRK